jgi:anthranilate synthase component 1
VRRLEKIGNTSVKDLPLPELAFMLTSDLAVMDHSDGTVTLIANAINWDASDNRIDEAYAECVARLDRMQQELNAPLDGFVSEL